MKMIDLQQALDAIPTNWLDSLLTGPDAALSKRAPWGCPEIEQLLRAIKARLAALPTMEKCDVCYCVIDSGADACCHCG